MRHTNTPSLSTLVLITVVAYAQILATTVLAQSSYPFQITPENLSDPGLDYTLPPNPPYDPTRQWENLPEYPGNTQPPAQRPLPLPSKPVGIDLDVTYINRTPRYNRYDVRYRDGVFPFLAPGTEYDKRWPDFGEIVTFTAHFMNKGTLPSSQFAYGWFIDGISVGTGVHNSLAPGAEGTVEFQWPWAHTLQGERLLGQHSIGFVIDPNNAVVETYESNNTLENSTGAISLILAVTPELYQALETPVDPRWPFSAEDWLQKQIAAMNQAFSDSVYPSSPNGILERVRLDNIIVVATPPPADLGIDGGFFMSVDDRFGNAFYDPDTDVSGALIHELSHQLGLPDLYGLDVVLEIPQVLDRNNQPVQSEFTLRYSGIMGENVESIIYDEYSTLALNSGVGYRRGYYAEFFFDIPDPISIRVLDNQGNPASNTTVKIYQRTFRPLMLGSLHGVIDNTPEITVTTDSNGMATLPNRSVGGLITTRTGHTLHDNPFGVIDIRGHNLNLLVDISKGSHQEYTWLDITQFNLAALRGESVLIQRSHVPPAGAPLPPGPLTGRMEQQHVYLRWQPSPSGGVRGYNVYRATAPEYEYVQIGTNITTFSFVDMGPGQYNSDAASYAITTVDNSGKESGFGNLFWAFRVIGPRSVVIDEQRRLILDPQRDYALLVQSPSGNFVDTIGSFDVHLEYSWFLSQDASGNLLLSHPGDYYTDRHSVRVTDNNGTLFREFGSHGSGNGQFEYPTGVAAWGNPCVFGGPYSPDSHTRLLLHFDGTLQATDGTPGDGINTSFAAGRFGQGVLIPATARLSYPTAGHFLPATGSLEFWFMPMWSGQDGGAPRFFHISSGNATQMDDFYLMGYFNSDFANTGNDVIGLTQNDGAVTASWGWSPVWQAGQWYHIAMTWQQGDKLRVYLNGDKIGESGEDVQVPSSLAERMFIGVGSYGGDQVRGVIDELRISDIVRLGNSDTCNYRFIAADQSNHRLQVFDWMGGYKTTFGTRGNGNTQFRNPQGVVVDSLGRVIVADSGNNRVQVLNFDGSSFSYITSLRADLNFPSGLGVYGDRWVVVADTNNNKVKVLDTTTGNLVAQYSAPNDGYLGNFNHPRGVAVEANGNLVIADTDNGRVVSVLGALPSLTPTPTSTVTPTSSPTLTPTITPTATPSPTATATPAHVIRQIYLPLMTRD